MNLRLRFVVLLSAVLFLGTVPARAEHFRLALNNMSDKYIADILALALREEGGDHTLETIPRILLVQSRALDQLNRPDRRYDVHYSGYTPARAKAYSMVRFPITRGMLGHRLLAITEQNRDLFAAVKTLADFRKTAILCSGNDWPDTGILRAAGLHVLAAGDSSLWPMLAHGRVNAFPRGLNEISSQIAEHGGGEHGARLIIDSHIMLRYRFDLFFFLGKQDSAKAAIIERGLEAAFEDGALDELLQNDPAFRDILADMKAHPRRVIRLPNPDMDSAGTGIPDHYWRQYP